MNVKRVTGKIVLFVLVITAAFLLIGCDADRNGHEVIFEYDFRDTPDSREPFFTGIDIPFGLPLTCLPDVQGLEEPRENGIRMQ